MNTWDIKFSPTDFSNVPIKNLNLETISDPAVLEEELKDNVKLVHFTSIVGEYTPGIYVGLNGKPVNLFESNFYKPYWRSNTLVLKKDTTDLIFIEGASNIDVTNFFIEKTVIALNSQFNVQISPRYYYKRFNSLTEITNNRDVTHLTFYPTISNFNSDINVTCTWLQKKEGFQINIENLIWSESRFFMLNLVINELNLNSDQFITSINRNIVFETTTDKDADIKTLYRLITDIFNIHPHLGIAYTFIDNNFQLFIIGSKSLDVSLKLV